MPLLMSTECQGSHTEGQGRMVLGVAQTAIGVPKESSVLLAIMQHLWCGEYFTQGFIPRGNSNNSPSNNKNYNNNDDDDNDRVKLKSLFIVCTNKNHSASKRACLRRSSVGQQ